MNENVEQIRNRIITHQLSINRVPLNTLNRFKDMASNDEFCSDYGFLLKYLIDFHDGIILNPHEKVMSELEQLTLKFNGLMSEFETFKNESNEKKKTIMLNGTGVE